MASVSILLGAPVQPPFDRWRRARRRGPTAAAAWSSFGLRVRRLRAPDFLEPPVATAAPAVRLVADRILAVVVLVILLRRVEPARGRDRRDDRLLEARLEAALRGVGRPVLRRIAVEHGGVILRPVVAELPVRLRRVDVVPEGVERSEERRVGKEGRFR